MGAVEEAKQPICPEVATRPEAELLLPMEKTQQVAKPCVFDQPATERGLAIECWSLVGEEDIARIERAVAHFVGLLRAEDAVIPENLRLIAACKEPQHRGCFVYRFGTRRLHFTT